MARNAIESDFRVSKMVVPGLEYHHACYLFIRIIRTRIYVYYILYIILYINVLTHGIEGDYDQGHTRAYYTGTVIMIRDTRAYYTGTVITLYLINVNFTKFKVPT